MQDRSSEDTFLNIEAKLKKDRTGLVPINYMFSGFECINLVQQTFDWYNGFRITMRRPTYPCKFGVYILTSFSNEVEHFCGHIVDVTSS